jgi:hypothetical protein
MLLATQVHLSSEDNHVGLQINQYFVAMIWLGLFHIDIKG